MNQLADSTNDVVRPINTMQIYSTDKKWWAMEIPDVTLQFFYCFDVGIFQTDDFEFFCRIQKVCIIMLLWTIKLV